MADGSAPAAVAGGGHGGGGGGGDITTFSAVDGPQRKLTIDRTETLVDNEKPILSPTDMNTPNLFNPRAGSLDIDDYFVRPSSLVSQPSMRS